MVPCAPCNVGMFIYLRTDSYDPCQTVPGHDLCLCSRNLIETNHKMSTGHVVPDCGDTFSGQIHSTHCEFGIIKTNPARRAEPSKRHGHGSVVRALVNRRLFWYAFRSVCSRRQSDERCCKQRVTYMIDAVLECKRNIKMKRCWPTCRLHP